MPNSVIQGKGVIKNWFETKNDIKTIIDIGAGSATYPKLLGDKYDYIGIEIFEPYVDLFNLYDFYQKLVIGDAAQTDFPKGDCIIFGDVLEHMKKEDGVDVLLRALCEYNHVVVSIPIGRNEWGKMHYNNEFEKHMSVWEFDEINTMAVWEIAKQERGIGVFCV